MLAWDARTLKSGGEGVTERVSVYRCFADPPQTTPPAFKALTRPQDFREKAREGSEYIVEDIKAHRKNPDGTMKFLSAGLDTPIEFESRAPTSQETWYPGMRVGIAAK